MMMVDELYRFYSPSLSSEDTAVFDPSVAAMGALLSVLAVVDRSWDVTNKDRTTGMCIRSTKSVTLLMILDLPLELISIPVCICMWRSADRGLRNKAGRRTLHNVIIILIII